MQIPLAPLVRLPIQKKGKRLEKEGKVFSSSSCTVQYILVNAVYRIHCMHY